MLKEYYIDGNKLKFRTIKIPKGTLLFRGIDFQSQTHYTKLFNDFIGYVKGDAYSICPTMNVFFYPVPYASESVGTYDVHTMYTTQYELELLLLIKPSEQSRNEDVVYDPYGDIITICKHLSDTDMCGLEMSKVDSCFTDTMLRFFPNIHGYIAISKSDANHLLKMYRNIVNEHKNIERATHILPSVVQDSNNIMGIPEIVLHPFHYREKESITTRKRFYNGETLVRHCLENRVKYTYFPLLYITNNDVFTFNQLSDDDVIDRLLQSERLHDGKNVAHVLYRLKDVFSEMLANGYMINNVLYRAYVDARTGFYVIRTKNKIRNKTEKKNKVHVQFEDEIIPENVDTVITYPRNNSLKNIIKTHENYLESMLKNMNNSGYSMNRKYIFNRGNSDKFILNYYVDKVLDRPDLNKNNIRKKRYEKTRKNNANRHTRISQMYGFDNNNFEDISLSDYSDNDIE
jgi:hypothetical protein